MTRKVKNTGAVQRHIAFSAVILHEISTSVPELGFCPKEGGNSAFLNISSMQLRIPVDPDCKKKLWGLDARVEDALFLLALGVLGGGVVLVMSCSR